MDEEYDVVVCGTGTDLALSIIECKNPKLCQVEHFLLNRLRS